MFKISTTLDKLSEAPLPVTGTLCRYWSHLTGSLNTWGLWIGLGKCVLTCDESSLASTHTQEKTGLCLAFLFHFFPNLHICWSGELPPLHLLLQGRSDSEGPGAAARKGCHTVKNYLWSRGRRCKAGMLLWHLLQNLLLRPFTVVLKNDVGPRAQRSRGGCAAVRAFKVQTFTL